MQLFKHLIHIFVLVIVVSFFGMGVLVMQQANAPDIDISRENHHGAFFLKFLESFVQAHPAYYGLKNAGILSNSSIEPGEFFKTMQQIYSGSNHPQFKMLHPMYVMLQE